MRSLCVVVPRSEGESVRKKLSLSGKLNKECRVRQDGDKILIPVTEEVDLGYPVREDEFEPRGPHYKSYKEAVEGVPEELMAHLPTSFDTVGDIIIMKLPDELLGHVKQIGEAVLKANPSIRLVAMDRGITGEERVRDLEPMAGEGGLETVHSEYGIRFAVDVSKCYFSPRLATERRRVADLVKDGERILDMFAGVGPFSIMIAKTAKADKIWAVDINADAVEYMKMNIKLNRAEGIEPVCANAVDVIRALPPLNRIIMNLPHSGHEFLGVAIMACANDAVIHYYEISKEVEGRAEEIEALGARYGRDLRVEGSRMVRSFSPTENHYAYDIRVHLSAQCASRGP
jgi:tRNA (guanine37-N1)-methyltransferase